ncbi:hypothetical protein D3C81_1577630 [compost metagenome]
MAAMTMSALSRRPLFISSCQRPSTNSQRTISSLKRISSSTRYFFTVRSKYSWISAPGGRKRLQSGLGSKE